MLKNRVKCNRTCFNYIVFGKLMNYITSSKLKITKQGTLERIMQVYVLGSKPVGTLSFLVTLKKIVLSLHRVH